MPVQITALTDPDVGTSSHRLARLASDADGTPVGAAFVRLFTRPGQPSPRRAPPATSSSPPAASAGC